MDIKLNVYRGREIEKTYITKDADIMFGVVEDLLDALDLEALTGDDKDNMMAAVAKLIHARKDVIYPLLKDVFDGLTDEELRRVKLSELVSVIVQLVKYSLEQIKGNFRLV